MVKLIDFAMCGGYSKGYSPYETTADIDTQKILLAINSEPLTFPQILETTEVEEEKTSHCMQELKRCGLVEEMERGGAVHFKPAFSIFSLQDFHALQPQLESFSDSLVNIVKAALPEVKEELKNFKCVQAGYDFPDLEYIVIGAYTFDYGGLEYLKKEGLLTVTKEMPGGNYVFTGFEAGSMDLRKAWMWGHNSKFGIYVFSGHGELPTIGPRRGFPDIAQKWGYYAVDEETKVIEEKMVGYGDLLFQLSSGAVSIEDLAKNLKRSKYELMFDLTFLEELEYVVPAVTRPHARSEARRTYQLNRPVLFSEDYKRVREISDRIHRAFLNQSLKPNYDELQREYRETSPSKNGIDMKEAFNMIYHSLFELAIRKLLDAEVLPRSPLRRDGARYSLWVAKETGIAWME